MSFIVFNTVKKAEHYIKFLQKRVMYQSDYSISYEISGNFVLEYCSYEWYCGSSEPENGYICCSDYRTDVTVIGRIKNSSYEKDYHHTEGNI